MKVNNQPAVLITGANGYVGSNLALHLQGLGLNITLSDRAEEAFVKGLPYHPCDFLDKAAIRRLVSETNFDCIFFFTGKTGTSQEALLNKEAFIAGNEWTLRNLLEVLSEMPNRPRVIFPSTRLIYKGGSEEILNEQAELGPISVYAENKLVCEKMLQEFGRGAGIDYAIFRISLPYASNLNMDTVSYGVMAYLLQRAERGESLQLFGDGMQAVSLVHIDDLCALLWLAGTHPHASGEIFNIGGPDNMSMREVIHAIAEKYRVPVVPVEWPEGMKSSNQGHLLLSSGKITNLTSYSFSVRFMDWIRKSME